MVARKRSTAVRSCSGSGDCAASPAAGVAAAMVAADAALPIMPNAAPPFRTVRRSKAFRSIVFLLFRDDCRLSLRPKSVGYGISLVKRPRAVCWDQQAIAQSTLPELSE